MNEVRQFCLNIALGAAQVTGAPVSATDLVKEAEILLAFLNQNTK